MFEYRFFFKSKHMKPPLYIGTISEGMLLLLISLLNHKKMHCTVEEFELFVVRAVVVRKIARVCRVNPVGCVFTAIYLNDPKDKNYANIHVRVGLHNEGV